MSSSLSPGSQSLPHSSDDANRRDDDLNFDRSAASVSSDRIAQVKHRLKILESDSPGANKENVVSNLRIKDSEGNLPLHLLFLTKILTNNEVFDIATDIVMKYPNSLTVANKYGLMPIHLAAYRGVVRIMRIMLNIYPGAASVPSNDGFYPLHMAAMGGCSKTCEYLYQFYVDAIHIETKKGHLPENLASKYGFPDTKTVLVHLRSKTPVPLPLVPGKEEVEKRLAIYYSISENSIDDFRSSGGAIIDLNPNDSPTTKRNNLIWSQFKNKANRNKKPIDLNSKMFSLEKQSNNILNDVGNSKLLANAEYGGDPKIDEILAESNVSGLFEKYRRRTATVQSISDPMEDPHLSTGSPALYHKILADYNTIGGAYFDQIDDEDDLSSNFAVIPDYLQNFLKSVCTNGSVEQKSISSEHTDASIKRQKMVNIAKPVKSKVQKQQEPRVISDLLQVKTVRQAQTSAATITNSKSNEDTKNAGTGIQRVEFVTSSVVMTTTATTATATSNTRNKSNSSDMGLTIAKIGIGTPLSQSSLDNNIDIFPHPSPNPSPIPTNDMAPNSTDNTLSINCVTPNIVSNSNSSNNGNNNTASQKGIKKPISRKLYIFDKVEKPGSGSSSSNNNSSSLRTPETIYVEDRPGDDSGKNIGMSDNTFIIPHSVTLLNTKIPKGVALNNPSEQGPVRFKNFEDFMKIAVPIPPLEDMRRSEKNASPRPHVPVRSKLTSGGYHRDNKTSNVKLVASTNYTFNEIPDQMTFVQGDILKRSSHSPVIGTPNTDGSSSSHNNNMDNNNNNNNNNKINNSNSSNGDNNDIVLSNNVNSSIDNVARIGVRLPDIYTDTHIMMIDDSDDEDAK